MTSLPSPVDDYAAPAGMSLTKAAWDAALISIGARLRAVEALEVELQTIIDAGVNAGHQSIADSLAPLVAQYTAEVQVLRDQIALAEDQLAAISEAGVVAANVAVAPIEGLPDVPNAQDALAEIFARAMATATQVEAEAGANTTKRMTPLRVKQSVLANSPKPLRFAYEDRAALRAENGPADKWALVDGLGVFTWAAGSTEPDDGETCFATSDGRWLIQAVSWDVVFAYWLPEIDRLRFDIENRFLVETAVCLATFVGAVTSFAFTVSIVGAAPGDVVLVAPPAVLEEVGGRLHFYGVVSGDGIVTVVLTNASGSSVSVRPEIRGTENPWHIAVIKGID